MPGGTSGQLQYYTVLGETAWSYAGHEITTTGKDYLMEPTWN
jgi:hypothetical protein